MSNKAQTQDLNELKGTFNKEAVDEIMKAYKLDNQVGNAMMLEYLKKYINKIMFSPLYREYSSNPKFHDEIYQEIAACICQGMRTYDTSKGSPTVFFNDRIREGIRNVIDSGTNQSAYYANESRKIRQIINSRAKLGLDTTEADIAIAMPNARMSTIRECFRQMFFENTMYYYDAGCNTSDNDNKTKEFEIAFNQSPESVFFQENDNQILYNTMDYVLTDKEKDIMVLLYGLYHSNLNLLDDILRLRTEFNAIELYKANGYADNQILTILGFDKYQVLRFYGLNKSDAELFCSIFNGHESTPEEQERIFEIQQLLEDENIKTVVFEKMTIKNIEKFLNEIECSEEEIEKILNNCKEQPIGLKSLEELTLHELLRGKGFTSKDIEDIFTSEKKHGKMSQIKVSSLTGCTTKEIKSIQSRATSKLKRALKKAFPERVKTQNESVLQEKIQFAEDTSAYVNAFMDEFETLAL